MWQGHPRLTSTARSVSAHAQLSTCTAGHWHWHSLAPGHWHWPPAACHSCGTGGIANEDSPGRYEVRWAASESAASQLVQLLASCFWVAWRRGSGGACQWPPMIGTPHHWQLPDPGSVATHSAAGSAAPRLPSRALHADALHSARSAEQHCVRMPRHAVSWRRMPTWARAARSRSCTS